MRLLSVLTIGLLITSTGIAQNTTFDIHPNRTSYTSRGNIGTGSGETLMGLHQEYWHGMGDNGRQCEHTQIGLVDQDQNSNTQETFYLLTRGGTDATGAGTASTDIIGRWGMFRMPSTPTGRINAWIQTVTFGTPQAIPCAAHMSWGAEMTNSNNWSRDGMSCHTSFSRTNRNRNFCHLSSEPHGTYFPTGASAVSFDTGNARTWRHRLGLSSDRAILEVGSTTDILMVVAGLTADGVHRHGMGGMFPNNGETLSLRTRNTPVGATVQSYISFAHLATGFAINAGTRLYLNPAVLVLVGNGTATATTTEFLLGVVPTPASAIGSLPFQTAVIASGAISLSNTNATKILP